MVDPQRCFAVITECRRVRARVMPVSSVRLGSRQASAVLPGASLLPSAVTELAVGCSRLAALSPPPPRFCCCGAEPLEQTGVSLCPMGAALVVLGVSVVIILLLITAVFMLERPQRRAVRAAAEPSASFKRSIEGFRRPRDETPEDPTGARSQTFRPHHRRGRRRVVYGPTELGDSLGFGKGPLGSDLRRAAGRAAMLGDLSTAIPTQNGEPRH
jgi:hypothetical protein